MPEEKEESSQATTEEQENVQEKLYPEGEKEQLATKKEEEKEEKEEKEEEEGKGKKEEKEEEEEKSKKKEEEKISVSDLHDAAIAAVEKWQANPTPENKKLADEAVQKAKDAVETAKKAEIKYDVKAPENFLLSKEKLEETVSYAREQGFSNEVAQALVERQNSAVAEDRASLMEQHEKLVTEVWPKEAAEDKEIGGENFNESAELAKRVLKKFAPPEFFDILDLKDEKKNPKGTGYGNHPALIKTFARIGKVMSDDQFMVNLKTGSDKKNMADMFYGDKSKKEEKSE